MRTALTMLAGLLSIGCSDVFGGNCGTMMQSDAFITTSLLSAGTNTKLNKAGDLVLVGTVKEIQPRSRARSRKNWLVVIKVDQVVSGQFSGTKFAFAVHSPANAGLQVGRSYTVKATRTASGYEVDELQWQ